jgi:hypothetical protein
MPLTSHHETRCASHPCSKKSSAKTDSKRFVRNLFAAFDEMKDVLGLATVDEAPRAGAGAGAAAGAGGGRGGGSKKTN